LLKHLSQPFVQLKHLVVVHGDRDIIIAFLILALALAILILSHARHL
jgi:hypothetical protein